MTGYLTTNLVIGNGYIQALQRGESKAFEALVEQFQDKIVNTCYGFVQNAEDAEDIAQEVFIEVYKSVNNFRAESQLSTWIYRIAVTKSLDFIRKKKRKKRWDSLKRVFGMESVAERLPSSTKQNPDAQVENEERRIILNTAIASLAENQRIVFTLHKFEGLSYKEIADVMDTSLSSVESLMHRAKKNLQKKLYNYYNDC